MYLEINKFRNPRCNLLKSYSKFKAHKNKNVDSCMIALFSLIF